MTAVRVAPRHPADAAPAAMREAAEQIRHRFDTSFASLTHFGADLLAALHAPADAAEPGPVVASATDPAVVAELDLITAVANLPTQTATDRTAYRDALLRIYRRLPVDLAALAADDTLCVGPLREGRQLAEDLGCLPAGRDLAPSAKRISYHDGILVGLSALPPQVPQRSCLIIDGVVASGATVMAIIQELPPTVREVILVAAHTTAAGGTALYRYAAALGRQFHMVVGHVSGVLNDHFYAVTPDDGRVVLGDVGDTISGLPRAGQVPQDTP